MGKNKKHETGGLQAPKYSVSEREEMKAEREKERKAEKREREKRDKGPGVFRRMWGGIKNIGGELKRVEWPTFSKTIAKTGVVLGVVCVFALVIFGMDRGLTALYDLLTRGLSPD